MLLLNLYGALGFACVSLQYELKSLESIKYLYSSQVSKTLAIIGRAMHRQTIQERVRKVQERTVTNIRTTLVFSAYFWSLRQFTLK